MLKLQTYTKHELSEMFGVKNMQGLKRKMDNCNISYNVYGSGNSAKFTITNIEDRFKTYCTTDLGFDGHTDFHKLRNYYYYFFNDEEFRAMPDEVQEARMRLVHKDVSRQTIAKYSQKLEQKNFIYLHSGNFIYYFAHKDKQRIVEKAEYCQAWREYWDKLHNNYSYFDAIYEMKNKYGGVARKQEIPLLNGIYGKEIDLLCDFIQESIEKELN